MLIFLMSYISYFLVCSINTIFVVFLKYKSIARPRNITLFLLDGDANGRLITELSNWSGKAYRIPRSLIKNSINSIRDSKI